MGITESTALLVAIAEEGDRAIKNALIHISNDRAMGIERTPPREDNIVERWNAHVKRGGEYENDS